VRFLCSRVCHSPSELLAQISTIHTSLFFPVRNYRTAKQWAMEGTKCCRCSPDQMKVAEKGTSTETIIGTSIALIRIGSIYKMLTCQLILTWLSSEWTDFSLESRCGVSLCRPMHLGTRRSGRGHGALSQHPHLPDTIYWYLYPKINPLEYISPWIVTSGVDYKAREE
jgi:hypothetical protein